MAFRRLTKHWLIWHLNRVQVTSFAAVFVIKGFTVSLKAVFGTVLLGLSKIGSLIISTVISAAVIRSQN